MLVAKCLKKMNRFHDYFVRALGILALVLVLIGFYNVVTRNISKTVGVQLSSNSMLELQVFLYNIIFMLGSVSAMHAGRHVRVDIFYDNMPTIAQKWINTLGYLLFTVPFALVIFRYSSVWAYKSWRVGEVSDDPGGLLLYPLKLLVPLTLVCIILQAVLEVIKIWSTPSES